MDEVFELSEWQTRSLAVTPPTAEDLTLAGALSEQQEPKVKLAWLHGGRLEVSTSSWVGVVRLSNLTIRVRPKYAGDELGVLRMLEYTRGLRGARRLNLDRTFDPHGEHLVDIICQLLAIEAEDLLRDGLLFDYSEREEALPALRGSLRFREQASRRFGQLDILECRFDEFHADVIENQLLSRGLTIAALACRDPDLRRRLRRLTAALRERAEPGPHDGDYYRLRLTYGRRNERYRAAHELSLLLIDCLALTDLYASGNLESFAFLLDMNQVFEDFVTALIAEAFRTEPWRIEPQRRVQSVIRRRGGKRYASIIPDIVMTSGDQVVPFDCKYKLYGNTGRKIANADIYQAFLYAYAVTPPGQCQPRAGILYPADHTGIGDRLEIARVESPAMATLTGIGVDLVEVLDSMDEPASWMETLDAMRGIVGEVLADGSG